MLSQIRPSRILPAPDLCSLFMDICPTQWRPRGSVSRALGGASAPVSASTVLSVTARLLCDSRVDSTRGASLGLRLLRRVGCPWRRGMAGRGVPSWIGDKALESVRGGQLRTGEEGASWSNGGRCWRRVRWEENGGLSLSRSCKEKRQPAENSPAWKKGSSQGALAQRLSFLIMSPIPQLLYVGPRRLIWVKRYWPSSVVMGGLSAGAGQQRNGRSDESQ